MKGKNMSVVYSNNLCVSKSEFNKTFDKFLSNKGYMTKLVNKANNDVCGYLIRVELPTNDNNTKVVAISFIANTTINKISPRTLKTIGINHTLIGGDRKLKKLLKSVGDISKIESESIISQFNPPEFLNEAQLNYFKTNEFSYNDFYEYVIAFENKIKKYYNNDNIKIIVVD
jgi:hypothetical protein